MQRNCSRATWLCSALALLAATGCAGLGGESVALRTTDIPLQRARDVGTVLVATRVDDRRAGDQNEVGKSTWTLFKVRHSGITSSSPLSQALLRILEQDLVAAGYPVAPVDASTAPQSPVLELAIDRFEFEMWSYLWPYVMIDGNIALSPRIRANGRLLMSQPLSAPGKSTCWFGGCAGKVEEAIGRSLDAIRLELNLWLNSSDFRAVWREQRSP